MKLDLNDIVGKYIESLSNFYHGETGAILEKGREDGRPAFLFTEVTGYAVSDCLSLYMLTNNRKFVEMANKAAEWIIRKACAPSGGVYTRYYFDKDTEEKLASTSFSGRRIYAFDTAICLLGLSSLYKLTKDGALEKSCVQMAEFLIGRMITQDGRVFSVYNELAEKPEMDIPSKWSRQFGAFHSKVAQALISVYEINSDKRYKEYACRICDRILGNQLQDGSFETSCGNVELHPLCYAAEGLLEVGVKIQRIDYILASSNIVRWILRQIQQDGCISQEIQLDKQSESENQFYRTDALAQVVALASDLIQLGYLDASDRQRVDLLLSKVLRQRTSGSYFGMPQNQSFFRYGYYEDGTESKTLSYWTNMFCLRAAIKYQRMIIMPDIRVIILAGGKGSRCWPISGPRCPKPFSRMFLGNRSLVQETIKRMCQNSFLSPDQIYVTCTSAAYDLAEEQSGSMGVPQQNIIIDDQMMGTCYAIQYGIKSLPDDTNPVIVVSMADNVIDNLVEYQNACRFVSLARGNHCQCGKSDRYSSRSRSAIRSYPV